jgi:hypothetical protein
MVAIHAEMNSSKVTNRFPACAGARERRRAFALACQDWTERRSHPGGALGAELCRHLFDLGWIA